MTLIPVTLAVFGLAGAASFVLLDGLARRRRWEARLAQAARPAETLQEQQPAQMPREQRPQPSLMRLRRWAGRAARLRRFEAQIPDTLLLIVAGLRAGHSPARAVQMVADEMPPPASEEFAVALGEIGLGLPAAVALARIAGRVRSPDWDLVVTAVTIQTQTGGNLAEILERISTTVRERVTVQGEITALTAEGRFSALILILLPPVLALLLALRNPHYFQPLTTSPLGHVLIGCAIAGQVLGTLVLRWMLTLDA